MLEDETEALTLYFNLTTPVEGVNIQQNNLDVTVVDNDGMCPYVLVAMYVIVYLIWETCVIAEGTWSFTTKTLTCHAMKTCKC